MHKNAKDNLAVLCRECHVRLHRENKELEVISTTMGKITISK
jgi:predicted HNH restriction endonuclease